jgi:hypothetical protein
LEEQMKQNLILIGEVDLEVMIVMLVVEKALVLGVDRV